MNLAEARFRKGLTQWDLKVKTGINQTKISLIERNYVVPRKEEKERLANALGVKAEEIVWPEDNCLSEVTPHGVVSNG